MNQAEIIGQLQSVFDEIFMEKVPLTPDLTANDVEEWDSLIQISILVAVERAFGIRFRVGEVEATANVGEFADLIAQRIGETQGSKQQA
jgi:acyl carrier protein